MRNPTLLLLLIIGVVLAACGEAAPPAAEISPVEQRQTARALQPAAPTLAADLDLPTVAPVQAGPTLQVPPDDPRAIGDPNAPVTIVEYSDFECPFCGRFVNETRPLIESEYIANGIVRLAFRDYPLPIHPSATLAAVASRCAADQGQFWPMHARLFATHQVEWGGVPNRDRPVMVDFARELQLDVAAFEECMADPAVEQAVVAEATRAEQLGVQSTPNFFINGQLLRGALPFEVFQRAIEDARS